MADAKAVADNSGSFLDKVNNFFQSTNLPEQIQDVDIAGLFTNPWFLIPFVAFIAYKIWKQAFKDLFLVVIFIAVWWASGTEYMQTLVVGEELQLSKVLPVLGVAAGLLGFVIYLYFVM